MLRVQSGRGAAYCLQLLSLTWESLLPVKKSCPKKFQKEVHSPLLPTCCWPPRTGRWQPGIGRLSPIYPAWTLIVKAGTCCGVTCGRFIVAGTVALGAVGFEDRVKWCERIDVQLQLLSFSFSRNVANASGKSARDWIGAVSLRIAIGFLFLEPMKNRFVTVLYRLPQRLFGLMVCSLIFWSTMPSSLFARFSTGKGIVRTSHLSLFSLRASSEGTRQAPQSQCTLSFSSSIFSQRRHWFLLQIWHNSKPSTSRWVWVIYFDSSPNGENAVFLCISAINASLFGWAMITLTRLSFGCIRRFSSSCWGSSCGTPWNLKSTSGLIVTWSASSFSVLSCRTCQTLLRVTFGGRRGAERIFWCKISLVLRFTIFSGRSAGTELSSMTALEFVCQNSSPLSWTLFRLRSKKYHPWPFSRRKVRLLVVLYEFESFAPAIRPDWTTELQQERTKCDKCLQSNCTGFPHCPDEMDQLCFLQSGRSKYGWMSWKKEATRKDFTTAWTFSYETWVTAFHHAIAPSSSRGPSECRKIIVVCGNCRQ